MKRIFPYPIPVKRFILFSEIVLLCVFERKKKQCCSRIIYFQCYTHYTIYRKVLDPPYMLVTHQMFVNCNLWNFNQFFNIAVLLCCKNIRSCYIYDLTAQNNVLHVMHLHRVLILNILSSDIDKF